MSNAGRQGYTTETLDKFFLEWSQFTTARTHKEILQSVIIGKLMAAIHPFTVVAENGDLPDVTEEQRAKLCTLYGHVGLYIATGDVDILHLIVREG